MTILTFDSAVPFDSYNNGAGNLLYYGDHAEAGYTLTGSRDDGIEMIGWDRGFAEAEGFHYDGPGVLATAATESVTLTRDDGESFAFRAIALDTQWSTWKGVEVLFEGRTDDGVVIHTVVLDDVAGLQTVTLPESFADVRSVTFIGAGPSNIQFDNIEVGIAANHAPVVGADLQDQAIAAKHAWTFAVPKAAFADADGDALALTATLADGSALPEWLRFEDGVFRGTPAANARGVLELNVTATDPSGASASQSFSLALLNPAGRGSPHVDVDEVELLGLHTAHDGALLG